jgi:hypothetical protein
LPGPFDLGGASRAETGTSTDAALTPSKSSARACNGVGVVRSTNRASILGTARDGDEWFALENEAEGLDLGLRPVGEVGKGAVLDLATLAVGLAEEDSWR